MIEYYVLDTETTGVARFNEINQISILRVATGKMITHDIAVKHPERAHPEALKIQNKTKADLKYGLKIEAAVPILNAFFEEDGKKPNARCIVAHNGSFDRRFCHAAWLGVNSVFPADLWLCTKQYATRWIKKTGSGEKIALAQNEKKAKLGLNNLLIGVGITPKKGAHNSAVDTENCLDLFNYLQGTKTEYVSLFVNQPHILNANQQEESTEDDF
jgi:DNA polymerase III epsilon subunit-like protein